MGDLWAFLRSKAFMDIVISAVVMGGFLAAAYVLRYVLRRRLEKAGPPSERPSAAVLWSLERPAFLLVLAVGARVAAGVLAPSWPQFSKYVDQVCYVLTVLLGAYTGVKLGGAALQWYGSRGERDEERRVRQHFAMLGRKVLKVVLFTWAGVMIVQHFGYDITTILATLGIASLALGLAAKDTVENMISGVTIMLDRPFRVGDRIQLPNGKIGDVHEIGLRTCKILTLDYMMVVVPNAHISTSSIINLSYPNAIIRIETHIGVAYGTDPLLVKKTLERIGRQTPDVVDNPPPVAYFYEHADSSLNFVLMTWISSYKNQWELRDRLTTAINVEFTRLGINIPFPMRTVVLQQPRSQPPTSAIAAEPPSPKASEGSE